MKRKTTLSLATTPLRRQAETRLRERLAKKPSGAGVVKAAADTKRLLHELQVHQIELKLQNEELQKARDEMEAGLAQYSDLYDFAPVGYFTLTPESTIRLVNLTGATLLGIERSRLTGQPFARLVSAEFRPAFISFLRQVFTGHVKHSGDFALLRQGRPPQFVNIEARRSPGGQECRAVVMDITRRKRAEARLELMAEAAGVLLSTDDPETILHGLFAKLGPALGVDAYFNYMVDATGGALRLASCAGIPAESARGIQRLEFGQAGVDAVGLHHAPSLAIRLEQSADPKAQLEKRFGFRAYACNPLKSGKLLLGTLSYASRFREQFDPDELAVLRTISHYVAVAFDRRRISDALRASEERYRSLFNSIDEGFCVIEMLFDSRGRPADYRYLEVTPSFEKQTGIQNALGKRMRTLSPHHEQHWYATYGKVALDGKPVRFVAEAKALQRWFDVYAFRVGGPESRKVGVLFRDITARKQIEETLRRAQFQLARHAGQLESMVVRRTAQLTATNRRLEASVASNRKGKEAYRALFLEAQGMHKKLSQLTRQILTAQEEERKKISRELHDEVVQTLVGINVELSALVHGNSAGARHLIDKIARTQRLVESSVEAVHRFARELRPAVLDDLGLIPALQAHCQSLAARKKLKIHLTAFGGVEKMESDKRTVLFRVVQESLNNVVRHARATLVRLTISRLPGAVRLEVSDNGISFSVRKTILSKNNKRLGLVGMKERIEMVGGNLTIESAPGHGTTVRAEIPFTPEKTKK